ncbi:hypothetical protein IQ247_20880 [Plectonema cf. radiosum LEGE 06105]|uniref:Uncharacterized protein n=1 Tax=Plectonema cf. radiosum LEGE 06105 TaxID=945769 RepID=A0A8J7FB77_9CYAN|nr:hypothetical protein [Plectonema radiosum]MBE9215089.1 hypothetical protein [Plectonema cf. radiosum LEGE 06105]
MSLRTFILLGHLLRNAERAYNNMKPSLEDSYESMKCNIEKTYEKVKRSILEQK